MTRLRSSEYRFNMQLKELKPNVKNPRRMSKEKKDALKSSLEEFGDLGGIVYNRQSKALVGGHQRSFVLPKNAKITIEKKYDEPTPAGTVAEGYVIVNGERFSYREVDWTLKREATAMIAANKHSGDWDEDLLKVIFSDYPDMDKVMAGFEAPQVNLPEDIAEEESDEEYVKNNPGPDSSIQSEASKINAANKIDIPEVKEKAMDVVNRRFVIIIDCDSLDHKDALREKLRPLVEEAGAKFF